MHTDPNYCDKAGFTPLHVAIHHNNPYAVKRLIEWGADVHHDLNCDRISPIQLAKKEGREDFLHLLEAVEDIPHDRFHTFDPIDETGTYHWISYPP